MLKNMSEEQLQNLARSIQSGTARGVVFTLADVNAELVRRKPSILDIRRMAATILEQAKKSPDKVTTYGEVWLALTGKVWRGNAPRTHMIKSLTKLIGYCHQHRLPMITVLVVSKEDGKLTDKAIEGICRDCQALGIDIGSDKAKYVREEAEKSFCLLVEDLPAST